MAFSHLHSHSEFSIFYGNDGAGSALQRVEHAESLGQDSLVISDHGVLCGIPEHLQACKEYSVKPIIGIEAYFKPDASLKDDQHARNWHLILIALNEQGWKNLIKLSTLSATEGFYYKPCVDYEMLEKYSEGVLCSSACISGYLPWLIQDPNSDERDIDECIEKHLQIFGKNYRFEIMPHNLPDQRDINAKLSNLSIKYNVPLLATGDSHYPDETWQETQDLLLMISTGQTPTTRAKKKAEGSDVYESTVPLHLFSEREMVKRFAEDHPYLHKDTVLEAITESQRIADLVEPFELDTSPKMPKVSSGKEDSLDILQEWCEEGLKRIDKLTLDNEYWQRMNYELEVIQNMDIADYFVLVGKMVRWARDQGIRISSGRGSAAGSLVCYLIKITTVDPIAHDLLFERFLNPSRKGLPDIDLDFEPTQRERVKEWLQNEYGADKVSNIVSYGTFGARGAIKDVSRVMGLDFGTVNNVTKEIPEARDVGGQHNIPPLEVLRKDNNAIATFAKAHPSVWKHALRVEGRVKQVSQHAGGVVVTDKALDNYMPLMRAPSSGLIVSQWSSRADMDVISMLNILKIDILSLDGLTRQGETVRTIEERTGEKIDLDDLPVVRDPSQVDPEVMELFSKGQTLNVFQFGGSPGIKNLLRHVKPDKFEDLVAVNALYRPGPIKDAFKYGDLKHGEIPVTYWHDAVKPILENTYGLMIFQEQLQEIAKELGNFPPSEADDMRKATSKLYRMGSLEARQFMSQYHDMWIKGCEDHGLSEIESETIWKYMLAFASYSFNKAHATSYSLFGYQDAWLKVKYPLDAYAASLTIDDNPEEIIMEARGRDVAILNPDINISEPEFTIAEDSIRYGLSKVKYVGDAAVKRILKNRPYSSYHDFEDRVRGQQCNSRVREHLLKAGAFDSLGERKDVLLGDKRSQEIEALGIAISGTGDSIKYRDLIENKIHSSDEAAMLKEGQKVIFGGELSSIKEHIIKTGSNKGKTMAYVTVAYRDNVWDCTLFRAKYEKYSSLLKQGSVIMGHGRKGERGDILVDAMIDINKFAQKIKQ